MYDGLHRQSKNSIFPLFIRSAVRIWKGASRHIEDWFFVTDDRDRKHLLKTIRIDGTQDQEIFERQGSAMWSASLAGDGKSGRSCMPRPEAESLFTDIHLVPMQNPAAYLVVGSPGGI